MTVETKPLQFFLAKKMKKKKGPFMVSWKGSRSHTGPSEKAQSRVWKKFQSHLVQTTREEAGPSGSDLPKTQKQVWQN